MLYKLVTNFYLKADNREQAEEAAKLIDTDLSPRMQGFPHGEVVKVQVDKFMEVSEEEISEFQNGSPIVEGTVEES